MDDKDKSSQNETSVSPLPKEQQELIQLDSLEVAEKLNQWAIEYYQEEKYQQALLLFQRVLIIYENRLGLEDSLTANSMNNLASIHQVMGTYNEAEILYQRVLEIDEKLLGAEHPDTAISLNNLALLYEDMQLYSKIELLYLRVLAIREKHLGTKYPDTLISQNNLAEFYQSVRIDSKTDPLSEKELELIKLDSLEAAKKLNQWAITYYEEERYQKALPLFQRVFVVFDKYLGIKHPLTTNSLNNLASLYQVMEAHDKAEFLYRWVLETDEKQYGAQHPNTVTSLNNLALLYEAMGLHEKALAIRNKQSSTEFEQTIKEDNKTSILYKNTLNEISVSVLSVEKKQLMSLNDYEYFQCLKQLNSQFYKKGEYKRALVLSQAILDIAEEQLGKKHLDTAISLNNLAGVYQVIGEYNKAEPLYQRALAIHESQSGVEDPSTASILNNLAELYRDMGKYSKAKLLHERALMIRKKRLGNNDPLTAISLSNLAEIYRVTGIYKKAEYLHKCALDILEKKLGVEHLSTADSLSKLAELYLVMALYSKAKPLYRRALIIYEKQLGIQHPYTIISQNNLALLYRTMGKYRIARILYKNALDAYKKHLEADHPHVATILNNLAELYQSIGIHSKAKILFQNALTIRKKMLGSLHPETTMSRNNLAQFYFEIGEYSKAERLLQHALTINEQQSGRHYSLILNNLAELYQEMGCYSKAEPLFQQSLELKEGELGIDHPLISHSLNGLAMLYLLMGIYSKAKPLFQRALVIDENKLGVDHPLTARSLNNLAALYEGVGAYSKAKPLYQRALKINEKHFGDTHCSVAANLSNLAGVYEVMRTYKKSKFLYQRALVINVRNLGAEHLDTITILKNLIMIFEIEVIDHYQNEVIGVHNCKIKRHSIEVIFFTKYTINALQISRQKNIDLSKLLKSSFIGNREFIYRDLISRLLNQNRLQEAEHVMAMYKEKEVADYYKKDRSEKDDRPLTLIDFNAQEKPWHERYKKITDALYSNHQAQQKLKEKDEEDLGIEDKKQIQYLEQQLAENEAQFYAFFDDINKPWPDFPKEQLAPQSPDALQKTLIELGEGVIILNYFVEDEKTRILLTTPTTRILRERKISARTLRQHISEYRQKLKKQDSLWELSQILYQILIEPVVNDLKAVNAKILMFALDDALRYLPMNTLYDGKYYLIERYATSIYTPAVGYGALTKANQDNVNMVGMGVTKAADNYSLDKLSFVENELKGVIQTPTSKDSSAFLSGDIYLDHAFNRDMLWKTLREQRFEIIHFATHFVLREGNGYESFLLLGEDDSDERILTIADLYRHPNVELEGVDLLTLSACDTAMSPVPTEEETLEEQNTRKIPLENFQRIAQQRGAEIEAFAAIAQQKGAKAVLASLWPVNDRSTSLLMQYFYQHWQQDKLNKLGALQKAQLKLIHSRRFKHPYFWSPFILMGNWL